MCLPDFYSIDIGISYKTLHSIILPMFPLPGVEHHIITVPLSYKTHSDMLCYILHVIHECILPAEAAVEVTIG